MEGGEREDEIGWLQVDIVRGEKEGRERIKKGKCRKERRGRQSEHGGGGKNKRQE